MKTTASNTKEVLTATKWNLDPSHSEVGFRVKHLVVANVRGFFNKFDGTVTTGEEDRFDDAGIDFRIDPASIDTRDEKRDGHLRSADFFDTETFDEIRFRAEGLEETGRPGHYTLRGDLTMKGVTRPVTLDVAFNGTLTDPWGNRRAAFSVDGKLNRKQWGLNWNTALEAGGVMVGDEVTVHAEVQLVKE